MSVQSLQAPIVALNDEILEEFPLTTEEPLKSQELEREVENINKVNPEDTQIPPAVIVDKIEPNKILHSSETSFSSEEDSSISSACEEEDSQHTIVDDNANTATTTIAIPVSMQLSHHSPTTTATTTTNAKGDLDISPMTSIHHSSQKYYEKSDEEDADDTLDDELMRITESNRFIPCTEPNSDTKLAPHITGKRKSLRSQSVSTRRGLLVFADQPIITKKSDRIIVKNHYGAGADGQLKGELKPNRKQRTYLVACDFSEESFHAIEWTMGTMMRDGDQLCVVTVVNREDNPEAVKEAGLSLSSELQKASDEVTKQAKKTLSQMLLFDIDLTSYAICGRVKEVMTKLISELRLTMVVCGSRGRSTVKGMLMGSISTYLVHKSPVPVAVIRPQKKKKTAHKKPVRAPPLSQSVKSGQLAVDELSNTAISNTTPEAVTTKK